MFLSSLSAESSVVARIFLLWPDEIIFASLVCHTAKNIQSYELWQWPANCICHSLLIFVPWALMTNNNNIYCHRDINCFWDEQQKYLI